MRLFRFFKAVIQEMKQVSWPGAKQTRHDTGTVVGISVLFAIFFAIVDWIVQFGLKFVA
ncbi:hypothetical protein FD30_GL001651 [Levilactobacillus namurensis DSM 19117]|uniref:Protein translocase subunit SecE n=2 Tax=Levilactobacillus namurensis TaxID=380393 RepID=A0A0R1JXT5_9LACO|nr:preprotein translocase subunit SecE [Levilactobacillus namurensis]PTM22227.1 preprotein translocase subunit SecE [Lactobacillus sp. PFC-70]KRK76021.1 hypothetical protein FD30_GL001651 [Levilactobacillus namurensis DSM 19117]MCW3778588.1 preprotein translocase subunit SecE [Levilactobacillus namurensis]MDT7015096.1 preprotein translocase subunit SecE [Levilactobacillus namurensis]MDT7017957.1 preprotein translocase subunit SecE [Levilactobacillus namurensis]